MKQRTQSILYHLLPVVFWLLAIGGTVVPLFLPILNSPFSILNYLIGFPIALVVLFVIFLVSCIKRHTNSVEECFVMGLLFGIAAYWLPTVVILTLPVWGYLIYQNIFSLRAFFSTLIGYATVAIWIFVLYQFSILNSPFSILNSLPAWIPLGAILLAWLCSTIARQKLSIRQTF